MQNESLKNSAKDILKALLAKCTEGQQLMFKRMYANGNLCLPIDNVVDQMDPKKMDHAITQCERSVQNNLINQLKGENGEQQ
jgi:hypothetical protein